MAKSGSQDKNPLATGKGAKNIHNSNTKTSPKGKPSTPTFGRGGK